MRLEVDGGNTRVKWRLCDHRGRFDGGLDLKKALIDAPAWVSLVEDVWVSSVHDEQNPWISEQFPQALFAHSQVSHMGLSNSYQDPHRMGVDRWLVMLAAWHKNPDQVNIIVDAGTAITLDIVDAFGRHVGGYICPGFQMMKTTLLAETNKVLAEAPWQIARAPGQSTQQCVDHGIQDMVACWVEHHRVLQPEAKIWMTGGNAEALSTLLVEPVELVSDLVLDGLQVYFSK
jgi:type III pantothenate kinase